MPCRTSFPSLIGPVLAVCGLASYPLPSAADVFPTVVLFGGPVTYPRVDVFDTTPTDNIPVTVMNPLVAPKLNLTLSAPTVTNNGPDVPLDDMLTGIAVVNDTCTSLTPVGTFLNGALLSGASCTFGIQFTPTDTSGINDEDFNDFTIRETITGFAVMQNGQSGDQLTSVAVSVPMRVLDPPKIPEPSTLLLTSIALLAIGLRAVRLWAG
jgi:hypothetical protein